MLKQYRLSLREKITLVTICLFQLFFLTFSTWIHGLGALKMTALNLQKFLNIYGATHSLAGFLGNYALIGQTLQEVHRTDKLFRLLRPTKRWQPLPSTIILTWTYGTSFFFILIAYWTLHCAERFCSTRKPWTGWNAFDLCATKLVVVLEYNFILYSFLDITLLLVSRLRLINRLITTHHQRSGQLMLHFNKLIMADVILIRRLYTELHQAQRQLIRCFRIPILVFYSINVYSLTFVALTAYNQFFYGVCTFIYASMAEFLLRWILCYGIILACVVCCHEAQLIAVNLQRCARFNCSYVKFFLMELRDRRFKFEIFRLFTLDFDAFLSMMGIISTYIVILIQFKTSTIQDK